MKRRLRPRSAYDASGNLRSKIDARATTCFGVLSGSTCGGTGYDWLDRPVKKSYSLADTPAVTWCYDGKTYSGGSCAGGAVSGEIGFLTAVGNSVAASEYRHDVLGRVTRSEQTVGGISYVFGDPADANVAGYEYDLAGGLTKMIYPSGRAVDYTYEARAGPTR